MKHIESFNRFIKGMFEQNPSDKTLAVIENFRQKGNYKDYYTALDSLGLRVGVEYLVQPVWEEESGDTISYIPSIKLHKDNPLTGKFEIIEFSELKSVNKAYEYVAKEQVYRLMNIPNLEELAR